MFYKYVNLQLSDYIYIFCIGGLFLCGFYNTFSEPIISVRTYFDFFHGRHSLIWEFSIPKNVSYEELGFVSLHTSSQFAFFNFAFNLVVLFTLFARLNIYLFFR